MESKTKHRILGLVVIAGLAVLLYPFIQGSNSMPDEQVLVKAPPFPDQATQVTSADADEKIIAAPLNKPVLANAPQTELDEAVEQQALDPAAKPAEANVVNVATPPQAALPKTSEDKVDVQPQAPVSTQAAKESVTKVEEAEVVKPEPKKSAAKKVANHKKLVKPVAAKAQKRVIHSRLTSKENVAALPLDNNGLLKLKQAAWVIQLGSFKQKANALKLVNKLRANGYRAFIQNVSVASGDNTRVFVGPEHQQSAARLVASDLEKEMKLHGIVISYQPFAL